jgi:hypothetical protein
MTKTISFNDTKVTLNCNSEGMVLICSHWQWIDDIAKAGHLRRKSYGPSTYGHVDFYVA